MPSASTTPVKDFYFIKVGKLYLMPGEHDAGLDGGDAFREIFGPTQFAFEHKGVQFIALDNVSDPREQMGSAQLGWLKSHLDTLDPNVQIVVFAHRPLFDLFPDWEWATRDGAQAVDLLMPLTNVTVFYGHIYQENHHMTGHIAHHSAKSLMFPLPAPGSKPKPKPEPWDPANPHRGLGFRRINEGAPTAPNFRNHDARPVAERGRRRGDCLDRAVGVERAEFRPRDHHCCGTLRIFSAEYHLEERGDGDTTFGVARSRARF